MNKHMYGTFARISPVLPQSIDRKIKKFFFNSSLRPTDAFIVAHPKSGNTWLSYALAIALNHDSDNNIHLPGLKNYIPTIHANDARIAYFTDLPNPRIFRNEWPEYPNLYPKTIYIIRDPRSVLVSYYHHYCVIFPERKKTLREFAEEYMARGHIADFEPELIGWDQQVNEWLRRAKKQTVLFVTYEEMKTDLSKVLEKIGNFLNITFAPADVKLAVTRTDFASMQQDEIKYGAEAYPKGTENRGRFIRDDEWKNYMDTETQRIVENKYGTLMKQFGYL